VIGAAVGVVTYFVALLVGGTLLVLIGMAFGFAHLALSNIWMVLGQNLSFFEWMPPLIKQLMGVVDFFVGFQVFVNCVKVFVSCLEFAVVCRSLWWIIHKFWGSPA